MLSIGSKIPKTKTRGGTLQPIIPLIPVKIEDDEKDKSKFITFKLKARVGSAASDTKYKKYCRMFDDGTPQKWVELVHDVEEIWTQNSITRGSDRAATIGALVRGEALTTFEASIEEARTAEDGTIQGLEAAHVKIAMDSIARMVFPHRALELQRLWMNRKMFKPKELSTRKTAAAINRINNCLPLFPGGTEASKFSETEIIGLLEWTLPPAWRAKFDLDGYIPTLGTKSKLITQCEAIKRNAMEEKPSTPSVKDGHGGKRKKKNGKRVSSSSSSEPPNKKSFFCSEHGKNPTHATADCYTLKNKAKYGSSGQNPRSFTNKGFRKELNMLARKSSKKTVLEQYSAAIATEKKKLSKRVAQRKSRSKASGDEASDDSDSDVSIANVEPVKQKARASASILKSKVKTRKPRDKPPARKTRKNDPEEIQEEQDYQKKIQWLKDHGESDKDETPSESSDSSKE